MTRSSMDNETFAEQVLFGETMADKLAKAPPFSEERWQKQISTPTAPGRPKRLRFRDELKKSPAPPGIRELEHEENRGALLHFFANHELMATELMALALLRFPDAPIEFRRTIWNTLQDEQRHLQLYLNRMTELGVSFGDHPVNALFWRHLSSMQSERDYVTGLCLTYEQANLDFAWGYRAVFETLGDTRTAAILLRVVTDEIGHVHHGVRWIEAFTEEQEGDLFARHLRNLPAGISMKAAMGTDFNEEIRTRAGLDSAYVDQLLSWRREETSPARLLTFNPRAEEALAASGAKLSVRPERQALESDLAACVWPLGLARDIVLVDQAPQASFVANLKRAGFDPPAFLTLNSATRRPLTLEPWAATPDADIAPSLLQEHTTPAHAFTREFDHEMQQLLCVGEDPNLIGRLASTVEGVSESVNSHPNHRLILKANFSASGSERIFAEGGTPLTMGTRNWVRRALARHSKILVEPWLDRVLDFSLQIDVGERSKLLGRVFFSNDSRGRYLSHRVDMRPATIPVDVQRLLNNAASRKLMDSTWRAVAGALFEMGHRGPTGIDAMVYRDSKGELQLRPVVEVNPRFTFGRIAVELRRTLDSDRPMLMTILRESDVRAASASSMHELMTNLSDEGQGALALTPVHTSTSWAMVLLRGPIEPNTISALVAERITNDVFSVVRSS